MVRIVTLLKKLGLVALTLFAALFCALAMTACGKESLEREDFVYGFSRVSAADLGTVDPAFVPEVRDGGLPRYPEYGKNLAGATEAEKTAILAENNAMLDYDEVGEDGSLYKGGAATGEKLFKHTAAVKIYGEEISSDAPRVARRLKIQPRTIGNVLTGLYAPAGEVITVLMDEAAAARNFIFTVGMSMQRGGTNDIPVNKNFNRMPRQVKSFTLIKPVSYIGSPLGGPIYIRTEGKGTAPFEVTIIGAVDQPHYVYGTTTDSDWEKLRYAAGTVFDLETERGVRLTMPASFARGYDAAAMRETAAFWDNASQLGNMFGNSGLTGRNNVNGPVITMFYDLYVPVGAAVAFVGADFAVLPTDWGKNALNLDQIVTSGGWGNFHEMNHHHQGWGAGGGGETTNNVINSLIYMLMTNVGAARTESGGLDGWNWVSSASATLADVVKHEAAGGANNTLSMYVTLAHAFGPEAMIAMANASRAQTPTAWFEAAVAATGYDMTYYLRDVCHFEIDEAALSAAAAKNLPMFVPLANLYQVGRDVVKTGADGARQTEFVEMGKPFYIPFGKDKTLDLSAYTVAPTGTEWRIEEVTPPEKGKLTKGEGENVYLYTPNKKSKTPDAFTVRYSLRLPGYPDKTIEDVTLKLAFMQDVAGVSGEMWEKSGAFYTDVQAALDADFTKECVSLGKVNYGYAGSATKVSNTVTRVAGKIVVPTAGQYTFYFRADDAAALYTGEKADSLAPSARVDKAITAYQRGLEGSYFTASLSPGKPLYFEILVLNKGGKGSSRIGWLDRTQVEGGTPVEEGGEVGDEAAANVPIVDVPSSYVFQTDADTDTPARSAFRAPAHMYPFEVKAGGTVYLPAGGLRVTAAPRMWGNGSTDVWTDGDKSTFSHTAVGVMPVEFVLDRGEGAAAYNMLEIDGRPDAASRGKIKDYELYAGDTPASLSLVSTGTLPYRGGLVQSIELEKAQTGRYLKVVVKDGHVSNNQKYVAVSDIRFGNTLTTADIAPHNGSDLVYSGKWAQNRYGVNLGGGVMESRDGKMEVNFHGTAFALFCNVGRDYGTGQLRVDGGEWQTIDLHADRDDYGKIVYVANGLKDDFHKIEVRARSKQLINVGYFGFKPTVAPDSGLGLWWILIGLGIAVGVAVVGAAGFFVAAYFYQRYQNRKGAAEEDKMPPSRPTAPPPAKPAAKAAAKPATKPAPKASAGSEAKTAPKSAEPAKTAPKSSARDTSAQRRTGGGNANKGEKR